MVPTGYYLYVLWYHTLSSPDCEFLEVQECTEFIFVFPQRDSASPHNLSEILPERNPEDPI